MKAKNKDLTLKFDKLKRIVKDLGSVVVAYSGGLDSSFLLKVSNDVLGKKVLAVTSSSYSLPRRELEHARRVAKELGARHLITKTREFANRNYLRNPRERCYYCKKELFLRLGQIARKYNKKTIVDGTNTDDDSDFRPGNKAKKEFAIRSPLREAGLTKNDIRALARKLGFSFWDMPSFACLSSRIPYNTKIDKKTLKRVEKAEDFLISLGFRQVRVRDFGRLAKIEVERQEVKRLVTKSLGHQVTGYLKKLGYGQVAVDLEGYKTGSLNVDSRRYRLTKISV
ncbi:MAG: ATP-dependent sacrificial sulfur transferase LarE [Candidatus Omnitrophica bacterium]|nr:ATP-dependent sacrificial sulfur transferase LarE [Candidatus Omnitrophota bacterium]